MESLGMRNDEKDFLSFKFVAFNTKLPDLLDMAIQRFLQQQKITTSRA